MIQYKSSINKYKIPVKGVSEHNRYETWINKITDIRYLRVEKGNCLKIISKNIWYSDISDLQPGHANLESSENDLVSDKMKEAVKIYNTCLYISDTI